jgi:hypothetical protein
MAVLGVKEEWFERKFGGGKLKMLPTLVSKRYKR